MSSLVIFMGFVLICGIVLAVVSQQIDDKITGVCTDKNVIRANKALVVISTICVILPIAYMMCSSKCQTVKSYSTDTFIYLIFLGLLGLTLTTLGGVMKVYSQETAACNLIGTETWVVISIGIALTLVSLVSYIVIVKGKTAFALKSKYDQASEREAVESIKKSLTRR